MKKLLLMLVTCISASCTDMSENVASKPEEVGLIRLSKEEVMSVAFDNPRTLSEESVVAMVNDFCHIFYPQHSTSVTRGNTAIIGKRFIYCENSITRGDQEVIDSIPLYTVAISDGEQQGYAIVSADERSAGVIACIPDGEPDDTETGNVNMMIKLSEISVLSDVLKIERMKATKRSETLAMIAQLLGRDSVSFEEVRGKLCQRMDNLWGRTVPTRSEPYDYPPTAIEGIISPVTKTAWSQKEPYSNYLPASYHPVTGMPTHYPAGCAIVAGVQTLAAVAPNITIDGVEIDWSYLTAQPKVNYNSYTGGDSKGMNMVATVVKDMYEKTGTTPIIDHDYQYSQYDDPNIPCVLSSSTDVSKLIKYLNQYVSCGKYYNEYVPDPLSLTLKANQKLPCVAIMGARNEKGGSHAWILDGYAICEKMTKDILRNSDLYFHANMGWGGTDDGFYKVNGDTSIDFKTAQGTYNIDFWEITEIHSK